eukprot:gene27890-34673_t
MTAKILRFSITALLLCGALLLGKSAWDRYMESAWTRDGRIKADVVNIGADVAGTVTEVLVKDNQLVRQGEILFVIDKARYSAARGLRVQLRAAPDIVGHQRRQHRHRQQHAAANDPQAGAQRTPALSGLAALRASSQA